MRIFHEMDGLSIAAGTIAVVVFRRACDQILELIEFRQQEIPTILLKCGWFRWRSYLLMQTSLPTLDKLNQ